MNKLGSSCYGILMCRVLTDGLDWFLHKSYSSMDIEMQIS